MDFEKFERIPESMLTDVTPVAETPKQDDNVMSDGEAFKAADHTKIPPLGSASAEPNQPTGGPGGTKVNVGGMFEGKYAVDMLDALLPALLVVLFKKMNIGVRKTELQLTESEKKTLAPVVQNCLNTIDLDFNNPWIALAVTAGIIYGSKVIEKAGVGWLDKQSTKTTVEKVKEHAKETPSKSNISSLQANKTDKPLHDNGAKADTQGKPAAKVTDNPYNFTEAVIEAKMKQLRRNREFALGILNRAYEKHQKRAA